MASQPRTELVACYDCRHPISFTATRCPNCGSTEPAGPYVMNAKEIRNFRIEARNDRNMFVTALSLGAIGCFYGWLHSASTLEAVIAIISYGMLGILVGAPLGFMAKTVLGPLAGIRRPPFK